MVFADHERILTRVKDEPSGTSSDPLTAIANAALGAFLG